MLITAQECECSRHPSTGDWTNKLLCTMQHQPYNRILCIWGKKEQRMLCVLKDLQDVLLCERRCTMACIECSLREGEGKMNFHFYSLFCIKIPLLFVYYFGTCGCTRSSWQTALMVLILQRSQTHILATASLCLECTVPPPGLGHVTCFDQRNTSEDNGMPSVL